MGAARRDAGKAVLDLTPTPAAAEAVRRTAERALAVARTRAEGHQALAAYYGSVLGDNLRALHRGQHRFHPRTRECPAARAMWGGMNSSSAAGRRRADTWNRPSGSIPAQRGASQRASSGIALHPPVPRGRAGPRSARSSSRRRTWRCACNVSQVALAQGDLRGRTGRSHAASQVRWTRPRWWPSWPTLTSPVTSCGCWTRPSSSSCCG